MRRRDFTKLALAGTAATLAQSQARADSSQNARFERFRAFADEPKKRIGFLGAATTTAWSEFVVQFEKGLRNKNLFVGQNVLIDYQWADGDSANYEDIVKKFVYDGVDVIVTAGTEAVKQAAKTKSKIPVVFASAAQGTKVDLGNHVTGLLNGQVKYAVDRAKQLKGRSYDFKSLVVAYNKKAKNAEAEKDAVVKAAMSLSASVNPIAIDGEKAKDVKKKLQDLKSNDGSTALYVCTDPCLTAHSTLINAIALQKKLPTIYQFRQHVVTGGLLSYGPDFRNLFLRAADLVSAVLSKTPPSADDVPIQGPFDGMNETVINSTTMTLLELDNLDQGDAEVIEG
jgi:putative tryptophan/tyrosine transport system substrate-binding protein